MGTTTVHPHLPRPIWVGLVSAFAIFLYINLIVVPRLVAERVEVLMEERKVGESRAHSKNDAKSGSASSSCAHSSDKVSFAPEPDSSGKAITSMQAGKIDVLQEAKEQQKYFCDRIFPQFVQRGTASSMMRLERDLQFGGKGFGEESLDMYVISEGDVVSTFITVQRAWQQRQVDGWVEKMDEFAKRRGLDREQLTFIDVGANIGWFTLTMANFGFNVLAFEPMQMNEVIQRSSLCHNSDKKFAKRVTLINHGLGDKSKDCVILSFQGNIGDGHTFCDSLPPPPFVVQGSMQTSVLDDVLSGFVINPKPGEEEAAKPSGKSVLYVPFVKMDTEGYESFVVRGSKNSILGKVPYMVLEFFSYHDRRDELAEMLTTAGYLMSTQAFHGPIWPKDQYHQDPPNFDVYAWLPDW